MKVTPLAAGDDRALLHHAHTQRLLHALKVHGAFIPSAARQKPALKHAQPHLRSTLYQP